MVLAQISEIFFLQLAIGSAFAVLCLKTDSLGKGFYVLNTMLALVSAVLALLFELTRPELQHRVVLTELFVLIGLLFCAVICQVKEWHWSALLFGAFSAGALALCAEVKLLAPHVLDYPLLDDAVRVVPFMLGSLLLGGAAVGMNLGHWYLVAKGLPFYLLENTSRAFVALVILRTILMAATLGLFYVLPGTGRGALDLLFAPDGYLIFFLMRVLWGIMGPFVLGVLVFRCVEIRSNTSATGLMYVVVISLLIGELLANYVTVLTAVPV